MSYDMGFDCGELDVPHHIAGGTYAIGGTAEPWLNITYNYSEFFYKLWPAEGIRHLYGKTAADVVAELDAAIGGLSGEPDSDYWAATEGNAKAALVNLRDLARIVPPNSVLNGD